MDLAQDWPCVGLATRWGWGNVTVSRLDKHLSSSQETISSVHSTTTIRHPLAGINSVSKLWLTCSAGEEGQLCSPCLGLKGLFVTANNTETI